MAFTKIVGAGIQTTTDVTVGNVQAGIITVTSIYGDASNLTGIPAGLGTALSQTQTSPLNKIYYTNQVLSIGSTITISPPASAAVAYTQYADIVVEQDVDLIIDDGDEFIPDILGLSTVTGATLSGVGGRVRADQFTNKAGTGAPTFTKGLQVTGVGTALLVTGDARVTGILTIGTSSVTLDGTNNQVNVGTGVTIHHTNGVQVGGNTVHSTGLTVNQINASGIVTATGGVRVGSSFLSTTALGLGQTTTTGRNAGIGTAEGTIIYNSSLKEVQVYKGSIGWTNIGQGFIEATGGTISDYESSGIIYRAHVFTSSGTFSVTGAPGGASVEYLVVAGGGSGGTIVSVGGGGGGAGGLLVGTGIPVVSGSYPVTVGAGGAAGPSGYYLGSPGSASIFSTVTSQGGGGGGGGPGSDPVILLNGGSGGGGRANGGAAGTGNRGDGTNQPTSTTVPSQGSNGGSGASSTSGGYGAGGGGGVLQAGAAGSPSAGGVGGNGSPYSITGIATHYAGGGGGGTSTFSSPATAGAGGLGGGGTGGTAPAAATNGTFSTGGGGGGGYGGPSSPTAGGAGGPGIVVVRYPIGSLAATAKATGGLISYAGGKTIHTFLSSGTFTVTNPGLSSVDYLVVGGGGAGGDGNPGKNGGGGGAGGFRASSGHPVSSSPGVYSITVGAGGANSSGTPSVFSSITSTGGGWGSTTFGGSGGNGSPGGSGGGGCGGSGTAGTGNTPPTSPPQGNPGGNAASGPIFGSGGGGGAGGNGNAGQSGGTGVGGDGQVSSISGSSVTYAGGGGGSAPPGNSGSQGGPGGGGSGTANGRGLDAQTNTGSGGGGSGSLATNPGGSGGSGIVIIAYPS